MTGMSRVCGPVRILAAELDAGDVGQHPVEEHEVGLGLVDGDQRLVAVGGGGDGEALLLEVVGEELADRFFVLDHEDACGHGGILYSGLLLGAYSWTKSMPVGSPLGRSSPRLRPVTM